MISGNVYSTALSGLRASEARIGVSANNVANSSTIGFEAKEVTARSADNGGVIVDVRSKNPATLAAPSPNGSGETVQVPNVSLDEEVVNQVSAGYDFKANLKVLQVQKELDKALLDISA
jgi:flagellar basal-body rod protein FlgC